VHFSESIGIGNPSRLLLRLRLSFLKVDQLLLEPTGHVLAKATETRLDTAAEIRQPIEANANRKPRKAACNNEDRQKLSTGKCRRAPKDSYRHVGSDGEILRP